MEVIWGSWSGMIRRINLPVHGTHKILEKQFALVIAKISYVRSLIILPILITWQVCHGQMTDGEIQKWEHPYFVFATKEINKVKRKAFDGIKVELMKPIVICKIQYDYVRNGPCKEDGGRLRRLATNAVYQALGAKVSVFLSTDSVSDALNEEIKHMLYLLKADKHDHYVLDVSSLHSSYQFIVIPYLEWNKTIPDFDNLSRQHSSLSRATSYTWTRAHAFLIIIDPTTGEVIYYRVKWLSIGEPVDPDPKRVNKVFRRCARSLLRTL